jgi:hypothetical protein
LLAIVACAAMVAGVAVWWFGYRGGPSVSVASADVRAIEFSAFPEGPPQAGFSTATAPDRWHIPLDLIRDEIPSPLPGPLRQGISCDAGSEVVFRLSDGTKVTYGPCRFPSAIEDFRMKAFAAIGDYTSKTPSVEAVDASMLAVAQAGKLPRLPPDVSYDNTIECRVDQPDAFDGGPIYLCALGLRSSVPGGHQWVWGALIDGTLHTHRTDPDVIPTITGPWDPPWLPT